jgi:hypothetical protein
MKERDPAADRGRHRGGIVPQKCRIVHRCASSSKRNDVNRLRNAVESRQQRRRQETYRLNAQHQKFILMYHIPKGAAMRWISILLIIALSSLRAQIDCDVTINIQSIPSAADRLQNFESDLENYINSQRWTSEDLGDEKIHCSINIFFTAASDNNTYQAQAFIGSQRPIYAGKNPSGKNSPMLRIFDDKWSFTYVKGQPLLRNETQFDELTDFLDFYMYVILGFDYDSYETGSGTPFFQKSYTMCNQAPSSAIGWARATGTTYNKFSFVEDILNPKYQPFREGIYLYHYRGLDYLSTKPVEGYKNMITLLENIATIKKTSNPRSVLFRTFFETKYGELAEVFKGYSDPSVYKLLIAVDPAHQTAYEEAVKSR